MAKEMFWVPRGWEIEPPRRGDAEESVAYKEAERH